LGINVRGNASQLRGDYDGRVALDVLHRVFSPEPLADLDQCRVAEALGQSVDGKIAAPAAFAAERG
jgi:hypothetical protein